MASLAGRFDHASRHAPKRESRPMPALSKEAPGRQRDLPPLSPAVRRRRRVFRVAGLVLALALVWDWARAPSRQLSVVLYNTIVIEGYRAVLRPMGNHFIQCRFRPTCSVYSEQAMQAHGFPKGLWLTTSRLFRCMPWTPFGTFDPVPPAKRSAAAFAGVLKNCHRTRERHHPPKTIYLHANAAHDGGLTGPFTE